MKVFITGANGLLATNIIAQLLAKDYDVVGLIRDPRKFLLPAHPRLQLITGDITDAQVVAHAATGCDFVIHCAATTSQHLLRYSDYARVNTTGTTHVVAAAEKAGAKRLVYVGTANTFGYGPIESPGNENLPPREPFVNAWYAKSKLAAQHNVLAAQSGVPVVIVSPTFMIGPFDGKPSSGAIIRMGYGKRIICYPPGGKNFVHVSDAARGTIAAMENGNPGEAYLLAGENLSYKAFFRLLAKRTDQRPILIGIPKVLLIGLGYIGDLLRAVGIPTALSSTNTKILCVHNYYSNAKACQQLDVQFLPVSQAIDDAVDWFRQQQML